MPYTYSVLRVSEATFKEIETRLASVGHHHAMRTENLIDMDGLALEPDPSLNQPSSEAADTSNEQTGS